MGTDEQILQYQLDQGVFDDANFSGTEGIAKLAVSKGLDMLSPKQKAVLDPYLKSTCSGVIDPGGYHNGCSTELEGQELLDAYARGDGPESLVCGDCDTEEAEYAYQRAKLDDE
tara:strand:+ start:8442 stop:8783 length:342 start_codon:yes stop_codon:yes gene_type:complete